MYHCHKWIGKAHQLGSQHPANTNVGSSPVFHPLWGIPPSTAWLRETSSAFQALLDTQRTFPLTLREVLCSHGHTAAQRGTQCVCISLKLNSTPQLGPYTQTTASCKVFIWHNSPCNKISLPNILKNHVLRAATSLHRLELDLGQTALVHKSSAWVSWRALQAGEAENVCIHSCFSALSGVGTPLLSKGRSYVPDNSKDRTKSRKEFREAEKFRWAFDEQTSLTDWLSAIQID